MPLDTISCLFLSFLYLSLSVLFYVFFVFFVFKLIGPTLFMNLLLVYSTKYFQQFVDSCQQFLFTFSYGNVGCFVNTRGLSLIILFQFNTYTPYEC